VTRRGLTIARSAEHHQAPTLALAAGLSTPLDLAQRVRRASDWRVSRPIGMRSRSHVHEDSAHVLPPLRWLAEEELAYDPATRMFHRPGRLGSRGDGDRGTVRLGSL
jgi:hypothetical protein